MLRTSTLYTSHVIQSYLRTKIIWDKSILYQNFGFISVMKSCVFQQHSAYITLMYSRYEAIFKQQSEALHRYSTQTKEISGRLATVRFHQTVQDSEAL